MGHNLFNFLYMVGMAHGASALTMADCRKELLKEGQFRGVATETDTPYNTLTIIRNGKPDPSHVTSLDDLCISLSVKKEEALQLVGPELLMYLLCERTPIAIASGVYDETELGGAEEQCVEHDYNFGNFLSRATPKKKAVMGASKEKGHHHHSRRKTNTREQRLKWVPLKMLTLCSD